jgi:hypothetical protein
MFSPAIDYDYYGPLWRLAAVRQHDSSRPGPCRSCPYASPSTACTWCRRVPVRHPDGSSRLEGGYHA